MNANQRIAFSDGVESPMFKGLIIASIFVTALSFAGCADPNVTPVAVPFDTFRAVATGPALRLVTERRRELGDRWLPTICSEPSPDVAIAFGKTLAVQASITPDAGLTDSGSVNATSTELATALAGRSAGVLALRDGLYAACQSYANGVIGHDAYALVLSQYGSLLVALAVDKPSAENTFTPQDLARSALLVSCISEYDPTRLSDGRTNVLLTQGFCGSVLRAAAGGGRVAAARPGVKKKQVAQYGDVQSVEVDTTTKTVYGALKKPQ